MATRTKTDPFGSRGTKPPATMPTPKPGQTSWSAPAYDPAAPSTWGTGTKPSQGPSTGGSSSTFMQGSGVFGQPGAGEQWYEANKGKFGEPTKSNQYWNGVQGVFQGGPVMPQGAKTGWQGVQGWYGTGGAGQGATSARDVGAGMTGGPGSGERYINGSLNYFSVPGSGEEYINGIQGQFGNAGTGETAAYNMLPFFNKTGQAEDFYGGLRPRLDGINYGAQGIGVADGGAAAARNASNFFQGNRQEFTPGASRVGQEYQYFAPGLREQSYSEKLYESGNDGLNFAYDRAADKLTKRMNDQAAAMGLFGSGFNARAVEEGLADNYANQARDMASLAGQADSARLGRTGAALDFTRGIDESIVNRLGIGATSARGADESILGGARLSLDARGMASKEALDKLGLESDAANNAQAMAIERMFKGGSLGLDADRTRLGRLETGANVAARGQELGMDRTRYGIDAAGQLQGLEMDRLFKGTKLGLDADQADDSRAQSIMGILSGLDAGERADQDLKLNYLRSGSDIAANADRADLDQLTAGGTAAATTQGLFEGRELTKHNLINDYAKVMSDVVGGGATDEQVQMKLAQIEAELKAAGMSSEQIQASMQQITGMIQTGINARTAIKGAK